MKIPTPLTPYIETIKLVLAVLLGCVILFFGQKVLDWKQAAQRSEQQGRTAVATDGILRDGAAADADRGATDDAVARGKNEYHDTYEEATRNEPETAARGDRAVPASVRNAFRARRLARERSGCAGSECVPGPPPAPSAER